MLLTIKQVPAEYDSCESLSGFVGRSAADRQCRMVLPDTLTLSLSMDMTLFLILSLILSLTLGDTRATIRGHAGDKQATMSSLRRWRNESLRHVV